MTKKLYGTDPDQVPTNADLGTLAYQDFDNAHLQNPLFQHDDSQQAKFKRVDGQWSTIEINAGNTSGNSRIAFTDPDTEDQIAQNTADGMIDYEHSADALRFYTDQTLAMQITSDQLLKPANGEFMGFEDDINILNHDPEDGGTDFDQTPTNNADGGGTTWAMRGEGYAIGFTSTSGGHGGTWMKVYCDEGLWAIKGSVRLTNTDGAVHGSTDAANYKFTHSFRFEISGGPDTGALKFDADAAAAATGTDFTRIAFSSAPQYMSAGYKTIAYATNGYDGVQQIYITDLRLVRVG